MEGEPIPCKVDTSRRVFQLEADEFGRLFRNFARNPESLYQHG